MNKESLKYYGFYLFGVFSLTLTIITTKLTVKLYGVPHIQVLFFRELIITLFLVPFMIKDKFNPIKAKAMSLQVSRHTLFAISAYLWYFGLIAAPINEVITFSFLTPVFAIILSNRLLKEKTDKSLWISLLVGFTGIIVMQYNKISLQHITSTKINYTLSFAYLASTIAIILRSYIPILNKKLSIQSSVSEMNYMSHIIFMIIAGLFFPTFKSLPLSSIGYLIICCITFFIEYYVVSIVYRKLPVKSIQPLEFSKIIFSAVLSYLFLGESFTIYQAVGSFIIIISYFISRS